jgi:prepilin-type N-terminal cleavage/methylation domain-containing protein
VRLHGLRRKLRAAPHFAQWACDPRPAARLRNLKRCASESEQIQVLVQALLSPGDGSMSESRLSLRTVAGVTLLEIAIVITIIGILAAAAVPAFVSWNDDQRVKSAARAIADAFLLARSEAIRTNNSHILVFANALGATQPITIANDGPEATANCGIGAGEVVHEVAAEPNVNWGTSTGQANGTPAPGDGGLAVGNIPNGSSFTDASRNPGNAATWIVFQADGIPRLFTQGAGPTCAAIGNAGEAGGAIYVTNGRRDYAVVLQPLGVARVVKWNTDAGAWSN